MTIQEYKAYQKNFAEQMTKLKPRYLEFLNKYYTPESAREETKYHQGFNIQDPKSGSGVYSLVGEYISPYGSHKEDLDEAWKKDLLDFYTACDGYGFTCRALKAPQAYSRSEELVFDHANILITDPCYLTKEPLHGEEDDWYRCNCGQDMDILGLRHFVVNRTLYGDWGCTVFNSDTEEVIGYFSADAGLVGIFDLPEVLSYNPYVSNLIKNHSACACVVEDFSGKAYLDVVYDTRSYEFEMRAIGEGNINFFSSQTSL